MTLKEKILKLKEEGKSLARIAEEAGCAESTVSYNTSEQYRQRQKENLKRQRKTDPLSVKIRTFFDLNSHGVRASVNIRFYKEDLIKKIGATPICYLSGRKINFEDRKSFSLDHIIPVARGGENTLENCNVIDKEVNVAKSDKTPPEFLSLCKEILEFNGYKVTKLP